MYNKRLFISFVFIFFFAGFLSAQKSYNVLMNEGNGFYEKNRFDNAASRFLEAVKQNENDFSAHYNLGNALYKSKKYEEAKAEYEKANQLAQTISDKASALHNLGNAHMQMNQPEKAAEYYKQSLKQEPYNEATRKNYEIAKLKEKENQQDSKQGNEGGGGGNDQDQQGQGDQQKESQQGGGQGQQQDQGQGQDGNNPNQNNKGNMPKGQQDALLNRISEKERETARRILNNDSYSMPESNEKDW